MPKIGMRMIKSAVAVFLCFLVYPLRGGEGGPFYSAVAAIICMQPSVSGSVKLSFDRTVATLFGGLAGMLLLMAERGLYYDAPQLIKYLIIAVCIIPLIYLSILVKMPAAASITCVVFLSTTVTHASDANVYLFALNRVIDTLIGIFVSLAVNAVQLPIRKRKDTLYLYDIDAAVSEHKKVAIHRLTDLRRAVSVYSLHMPPFFPKLIDELNLGLPAIVMGGAAMYHPAENRWSDLHCIPPETVKVLTAALSKQGLNSFLYTLLNNILNICHMPPTNVAEEALLQAALLRPCINLLPMPNDPALDAVCLCAVGRLQTIEKAVQALSPFEKQYRLCVTQRAFELCEGYNVLEIRRADVSIDAAAQQLLLQTQATRVEYV